MAAVNTFGGKPLVDPAHLLRGCLARNLPTAHWHGRATVAVCPSGRRYGTATVLMALGDLSRLDLKADHTLILSDFRQRVTLKRYSILAAEAAVPGLAGDPATPYLVVAADSRLHLDRSPFSTAYNVPDGAGGLVSGTTNSGTPWTWATMVADLWGRLPAGPAGAAPTLPFTPDGRPEGWRFWGHPSAWQALNDVLDRLCCVLVYDPTTDTFNVERQGAADAFGAAVGAAFVAAAKNDLTWDGRPVVAKRTARPEKVLVRFRRDPSPTATDPFYTVTLALTADPSAVAGTTLLIADDLTALGATGAPSNAAALATRAAERKADFERSLVPAEKTRVTVWRGLWPTAIAQAGALAGGVCWGDRGGGWTTEIGVSDPPRLDSPRLDDLPASGASLATRNVDGTAANAATADIRANQATGIKFTTTGGYQRLDIDPVTLASTLTYDITVAVPTCISIILTKTYATTTLGGQSVLTNVTADVAWKTKTVSMLHGTTVGAAGACVAPASCCPTGAVSLACGDGVTYTTLTFSAKTLDCTCLPATGTYAGVPGAGVLARWTTATCPGNVQWDLKCVDDVYLLYAGGVACTPVSAVAGTMVFDSPNLGANCGGAGGTCRVTITP